MDMEYSAKINEIGNKMKLEMSTRLNTAEYMLWIDPLIPYNLEAGNTFIYIAPNRNVSSTLLAHYSEKFIDVAQELKLPVLDVFFIPKEEFERLEKKPLSVLDKKEEEIIKVNPFVAKYTFDNFVIDKNNEMAFVSAHTVAENPGVNDGLITLNPLYVYGGVGLGKTHLLHSIGNYLFENNPSMNVIYTTAEKMSNEYFGALSKYSNDKDSYRNFRQKYASCDVLMIDDVQFMQKKGGLQDLFFHIFNDLYINNKQIVLASDRPPKDINDIEDRLRSRFECGLTTDINAPSLDTRINIIKKKMEGSYFKLNDDIIYYLAEKINSNIRELEGSLSKIIMFSRLNHQEPTLEIAKEVLKIKEQPEKEQLNSDKIINKVGEYFRLTSTEIIGKKKTKEIAQARMIAIYLVCTMLNLPLVNIGQIFGGRDHTTVIYSRDKISAQIGSDNNVDRIIRDIKETLDC